MKSYYLILPVFFGLISCSQSQEISQWRGPDRDGIYEEQNLLDKWPENGPELLWSFEGLGRGYGNAGITKDQVFVCGMLDSTGVLFAFDHDGNLLWKKEYGPEWNKSYEGSRTTPTIIDDLLYIESGHGLVCCYKTSTGELMWSVDLFESFDARKIQWGLSESLLIDGDRVYCTPGGEKNNIVALNRFTGETIWSSPGNGQPAAYCSPVIVNHNNTKLLITMTSESLIGIDAYTGALYWHVEHYQGNDIHANTPVYFQGKIVCATASDNKRPSGTLQVSLLNDGKNAEISWRNEKITNLMNGFILIDGFVFGSPFNKKEWHCFKWDTGELQYTSKDLESGPVIYADGHLYCYSNKGEMALVKADEEGFDVISRFTVPLGTDQHWAHPVIKKGRLYIRHGDALMVYQISETH